MFKRKNNKEKLLVEFWAEEPLSHTLFPMPSPAYLDIPQWYRDLNRFSDGKLTINENGMSNARLKACTSYMDTFMMGYMVKLHCDILIEDLEDGSGKTMRWTSSMSPISPRSMDIANELPEVAGFGAFTQAWEMKWGFKLPKGYSMLVTQPFNRQDLPTWTTQGIIDADEFIGPGGVPFAIKDSFSGMLKAGTPIIQLIPFKRDSWESKEIESPFKSPDGRPRNYATGWYKKTIWKKKDFR